MHTQSTANFMKDYREFELHMTNGLYTGCQLSK